MIRQLEKVELSEERLAFHEQLRRFKTRLAAGCLIYDIGKSKYFDYAGELPDFVYRTVDCKKSFKPDIVLDVESAPQCRELQQADAIIVNGVYEQCKDPDRLLDGCRALLKPEGLAPFGLIATGYPLKSLHRRRIRFEDVPGYLRGFRALETIPVRRGDEISYVLVTAEKVA